MSRTLVPYIENKVDADWVKTIAWNYGHITLLEEWGYTLKNLAYQKMMLNIYEGLEADGKYYLNHDEMGLLLICINRYLNQYKSNKNSFGPYNRSLHWEQEIKGLYNRLEAYWKQSEAFITGYGECNIEVTNTGYTLQDSLYGRKLLKEPGVTQAVKNDIIADPGINDWAKYGEKWLYEKPLLR